MCCFSGRVQVGQTKIFARLAADRQIIVYEMTFSADAEVAMVLPLPIAAHQRDIAIEFIDLSGYPKFFVDLARSFSLKNTRSKRRGPAVTLSTLKVHNVGAFEASFVPQANDFSRLDPRFRIDPEVWKSVPEYHDYGFAVFKLRPGTNQHVHPMAFSFASRHPDRIVFPTLHIHDGAIQPWATFDHDLYAQLPDALQSPKPTGLHSTTRDGLHLLPWRESTEGLARHMKFDLAREVVSRDGPCFTTAIHRELPNEDLVLTW